MAKFGKPKWDVPGWDWDEEDNAWLEAGVGDGTTSIFFIHGGRIRHQAHIPEGHYTVEQFTELVHGYAEGLDNPHIVWLTDTGGGDCGLWVEGTRAPNVADLERLQKARERIARSDRLTLKSLRKKYPERFVP